MNCMDKLIITVGLPGSGKTTWSKEQARQNKKIKHIDIDYHMFEDDNYTDIEDEQERFIKILKEEQDSNYQANIIDGLFLNTQDIIKILLNISYLPDEILEIHYWNENRELCLYNDRGRREKDSKITIDNFKLEKIDIQEIKDTLCKHVDEMEKIYHWRETCYDFDIVIVEHEVEEKPEWLIFTDEYDIDMDENNEIVSETWKVGGTWWSYTGAEGDIEPESQPSSFRKLDEILDELNCHISFSDRRTIMDRCVTIRSKTISDYYSRELVEYFVCDVEELYEVLNDLGLVRYD